MSFNPNDKLVKLKGKEYLEVKWRLVWFRGECPGWGITTEKIQDDGQMAEYKATITDPEGRIVATGHKQECKADFGDFREKAETGAVGRALGMLGYGTQFAPEFEEGERIVDAPVDAKKQQPQQPQEQEPEWDGAAVPTEGQMRELAKLKNMNLDAVLKAKRKPFGALTDEEKLALSGWFKGGSN